MPDAPTDSDPGSLSTRLEAPLLTNRRAARRGLVYACPHCRMGGMVVVLRDRPALLAHLARRHPVAPAVPHGG